MAKYGDFGGLPESRFNNYLQLYTRPASLPHLNDAQRRDVLAALAEEEHAAAKSAGNADLIAIVLQCAEIEEQHRKIVNGGTSIQAFVTSIIDLKGLW